MFNQSLFFKDLKKLFLVTGIAFLVLSPFVAKSQETKQDSIVGLPAKKNSLKSLFTDSVHSPKKAMILSAILPGAGQLYNKKYWKIPVVYAGFAALGYSTFFNNSQYVKYKTEFINRQLYPNDTTLHNFPEYEIADVNTLQEYYRRYRDLSVIGILAFYTLNVVDAGVDAHLLTFNVDEDLSVQFQPALYGSFSSLQPMAEFKLTWKL